MAGRYAFGVPGIDERLPFFEQPSERRDVDSWHRPIRAMTGRFGLKVKQLVSDRASALLQLSKAEYLNVPSMPDLFHFNQLLARKAGAVIGRAWKEALKAYLAIKGAKAYYSERQPLEYRYLWQNNCRCGYQKSIQLIHRAVHPFAEKTGAGQTPWKSGAVIEKEIRQSILSIDKQLIKSRSLKKHGEKNTEGLRDVEQDLQNEGLDVETIEKLCGQLPGILKGVEHWQGWTEQRVDDFLIQCYGRGLSPQLDRQKVKTYLLQIILPMMYWQNILTRTPSKSRNKKLRTHYQKTIAESVQRWQIHPMTKQLTGEQQLICQRWAGRIARSFQRASSQVEGRNGCLAFAHKAHRGLPGQRLKVLTVVHNFDVRGMDNRTPAERLFRKGFPDVFEFVLNNVTSFSQPRQRKRKPGQPPAVRA